MIPTILLVDPDPAGRRRTAEVLEGAGLQVRSHAELRAALDDAAAREPDAIVLAARAPGDHALAQVRALGRRFPARGTPVAVLSPSPQPADVAATLAAGADDCLPDACPPELLVATVRARLRPRAASLLRGELAELPFAKLMQLCERTGLSGALEAGDERVEFVAGALAPGARAAAARLLEQRQGAFVLRARAVHLDASTAAPTRTPPPRPAMPSPMHPAGHLSGLRVGERVLQIQTEYTTVPDPRFVSVVMLGGRTVHQRATAAPSGAGREELDRRLAAQHAEVERALRAKVEARAARGAGDGARARFDRLHDEGLGRFLGGDFAGAVSAWEEALRIDPQNEALSVNLTVARRKRDAGSSADRSAPSAPGVVRT
jgi:DNA-binding response OmpR family regulator